MCTVLGREGAAILPGFEGTSENRVDDATADGSAGPKTCTSQYMGMQGSEGEAHLLHQRRIEPSVAICLARTVRKEKEGDER